MLLLGKCIALRVMQWDEDLVLENYSRDLWKSLESILSIVYGYLRTPCDVCARRLGRLEY